MNQSLGFYDIIKPNKKKDKMETALVRNEKKILA